MKTPVARMDGKVVGHIEDGTFYTSRDRAEHYFRKFNGYSINRDIVDRLRFDGVERVCITETNALGRRNLWSDLAAWSERGTPFSYDGDEQLVLMESAMEQTEVA